jgi:hypothetical protein
MTLSRILNLQNTLPQIVALQHPQKAIHGIIHPLSNVINGLEAPVLDPFRDILVTSCAVFDDVGIEDEEALPFDATHDQHGIVFHAVRFGGGGVVVLRNGAACDCSSGRKELVEVILEVLGKQGLDSPTRPKVFIFDNAQSNNSPPTLS